MRFNQIPIGTLGSLRQAIAAVLLVSSFTADASCGNHSCDPIVVEATIYDAWEPPSDPNPLDPSGFYDHDPGNDASGGGDPLNGDPHMQVCDWIRERRPDGCNQPTAMPQGGLFPSSDDYIFQFGSAIQRMLAYALATTDAGRYDAVHGALSWHTQRLGAGNESNRSVDLGLFEDMAYTCLQEQIYATQVTQFSGGAGNTDANRMCQEALAAMYGEITGSQGWWTFANMLLSSAGINVSFSHSVGPASISYAPTSFNSLQHKAQAVRSQATCALYYEDLARNDCN